jgi:O-antigen/teichoic acid export membrane protein
VESEATGHSSAIDSLGRGTTVMVLGTIALLLLNFIGRVYAARNLTVAQFGSFNLGLALAGLLALVALLGLHQAMARSLAENPDPASRRRLIRWTAGITAVTSVSTSVIVYVFAAQIAQLFDPSQTAVLTEVFQFFSVTVGLTLLCTFMASIFQGFEDTVPNAWLNQAVQPAAFAIFLVIFFRFHLALEGALLAWVISNIVTFLALLTYSFRRLPKHLTAGSADAPLPKGLFSLSVALWGVTTLTFVTAYVDTLILGAFRPAEQVGIYSAMMLLARLILVVAAAVTYIFLPVAARLTGQKDMKTLGEMFVTTTRWMMIFTIPIFFLFTVLPHASIVTVFGTNYVAGDEALELISVGAFVSILFGPVNAALAGMGVTRPLLLATGISAAANAVLSVTLIPTYGLLGAAIAWTTARFLYPASAMTGLYESAKIHPFHRTLLVPLAVTLALGIPLFYGISILHHPAWIVFPLYFVGLGLCIGVVLATRSVEPGDFVAARMAERALGRPLPRLHRLLERSLPRARAEPSDAREPLA